PPAACSTRAAPGPRRASATSTSRRFRRSCRGATTGWPAGTRTSSEHPGRRIARRGGEERMIASIGWGMIGAGSVTELKSGPAFQKAEGSALAAVMRRSPGKAAEYAHRHGVPRYHERALDLIY